MGSNQSEGNENEVPIDSIDPATDLILLTGIKGVLCASHVERICAEISTREDCMTVVVNNNGRTALVRAPVEVVQKYANTTVVGTVLISAFAAVAEARKHDRTSVESAPNVQ